MTIRTKKSIKINNRWYKLLFIGSLAKTFTPIFRPKADRRKYLRKQK